MLRILICMLSVFLFSQDGFAQTKKKSKVKSKSQSEAVRYDSAPSAPARSYGGSSRVYNARISPIGVAIGALIIGLDYKLNNNWTVGPEFQYINYKLKLTGTNYSNDITMTSYGLGVRGNWFVDGVYKDGWYVAPFGYFGSAKASGTGSDGVAIEGTASALIGGAMGGYGWFWDQFNMMLAGGLSMPLGDGKVEVKDSLGNKVEGSVNGSGLALEFSLGWVF